MKKMIAAAAAAMLAASMVTTAFADDVSVRTSIGSGEVAFTETSEAVDVSAEELTQLVKDAISAAEELEVFSGLVDAEANVSLAFDEENSMNINASVIGTMDKSGDNGYASFFYSLEGLGDPQSAKYETYHWVDGDTHYTAVSDGSSWKVEEEDFISQLLEQVSGAVESDQADQFTLDEATLQPNLYEDEDGNKYYVCIYDKDMAMNSAGSIEGVDMYASMADGILGDNDLQMIVVVSAETHLPRAVSLNASGASGQLPAELLGGEGSLEFSADDLYVTFLMDTFEQEIEIPEEVLNTSVSEDEGLLDLDLGSLLGAVGMDSAAE